MKPNYFNGIIGSVETYEALSIEEQMMQVKNNNEPIEHVSEMIYTDRKDGVQPQYDIRTDRFEIAVNAMDKVSASYIAKREEVMNNQRKE